MMNNHMNKKDFLYIIEPFYGDDLIDLKRVLPSKKLDFEMRDDYLTQSTIDSMLKLLSKKEEAIKEVRLRYKEWIRHGQYLDVKRKNHIVYAEFWDEYARTRKGSPMWMEIEPIFERMSEKKRKKLFCYYKGRLGIRCTPFFAYWKEREDRAKGIIHYRKK